MTQPSNAPRAATPSAAADFTEFDKWIKDPGKREAFRLIHAFWLRSVQPQHRAAATPTFLFLYATVKAMAALRVQLADAGLLGESTARKAAREKHPVWKPYSHQMIRANSAILAVPELSGLSLYDDFDKVARRLVETERKFRG